MKKFVLVITSVFIMLFPFVCGCGDSDIPDVDVPESPKFVYTVTLNLDYVIPCTYKKRTSSEVNTISVVRDGRISDLTSAVPIGDTEYEFSRWEYVSSDGTKYAITPSTKFTSEIFGDNEQVVLNAVCVSDFTPRV